MNKGGHIYKKLLLVSLSKARTTLQLMLAEYMPREALFTVLAVRFAMYSQIAGSTEYSQQNTFSIANIMLGLSGMPHQHARTDTYASCMHIHMYILYMQLLLVQYSNQSRQTIQY